MRYVIKNEKIGLNNWSAIKSLKTKISQFNRDRKWQLFLEHISPNLNTTILDVGYSDIEYISMENYLEKNYPFSKKNITALGIDKPSQFSKRYPEVRAVVYDGKIFPFGNREFDVCWSNATIEHVGDNERQLLFLMEMIRVSRRVFFTTPNRLFPIEIHTSTPFLHYLPSGLFDSYLRMTGKGWASGDYMHLLTYQNLREMLKKAGIQDYQIIKNRLFGFVMDFVVII